MKRYLIFLSPLILLCLPAGLWGQRGMVTMPEIQMSSKEYVLDESYFLSDGSAYTLETAFHLDPSFKKQQMSYSIVLQRIDGMDSLWNLKGLGGLNDLQLEVSIENGMMLIPHQNAKTKDACFSVEGRGFLDDGVFLIHYVLNGNFSRAGKALLVPGSLVMTN